MDAERLIMRIARLTKPLKYAPAVNSIEIRTVEIRPPFTNKRIKAALREMERQP